ncbi:MAG: alkaline phosphatase D family protein [Ilumatobacteraceae bacterium]
MSRPISRRVFLALGASVVVAACSSSDDTATQTTVAGTSDDTTPPTGAPDTLPPVDFSTDPFTLGVASGDPSTESVIIWTRLAPDPLNGGGLSDTEYSVRWELARDADFTDVVAAGDAIASPRHGHSVHAEVSPPANEITYYRFRVGDFTSPVGITRLAPDSSSTEPVRIATASCQNYTDGYYTAYDDMVKQSPDLVVFLGDYIYEGGMGETGAPRQNNSEEPKDLVAYRNRYALYKSDPLLQAAHATCPWVITWDDHEVENNYAGFVPQDAADAEGFAARRVAAYQAWWEHMPVRMTAPIDGQLSIYRQISWGGLINMLVLDGRQYRDDQACADAVLKVEPACPEASLPERSMLGSEQERWVADNIASDAVWAVIANQTVMSDIRLGDAILNYDQWDGYSPSRDRVLESTTAADNLIVLTGDIHLAGVGQLTTSSDPSTSRGVEFVTTSITSDANIDASLEALLVSLPNIIDAEVSHRGYTLHTVTANDWTAQYRIVDDARVDGSAVSVWKTFAVTAGTPTVTAV